MLEELNLTERGKKGAEQEIIIVIAGLSVIARNEAI